MEQKKINRILLIALSVMIIIGIILVICLYNRAKKDNIIEFSVKDGASHSVDFGDIELNPGDKTEYTVNMKAKVGGDYNISFVFTEKATENSMAEYVTVKIENRGEVVCDAALSSLMRDGLTLPLSLKSDELDALTITYYLPGTVGNEAQGKDINFSLTITSNHR